MGAPGRAAAPTRASIRAGCAALFGIALAVAGCVSAGDSPATEPGPGSSPAYRALFRVETDGPAGRRHFKMAAALLPPERLRLEFFAAVGGARLIVASDGANAVALLPQERSYDAAPDTAESLDRMIGVPLRGSKLIALLTGRPMCDQESADQQVQTKLAAAFGRTVAWYEVTCPPDEIRYQARCQDRGGILSQASVRDGISGDMILEVEYEGHEAGQGPRWPRRIRIRLAREKTRVDMTAVEGPVLAAVGPLAFTPPIPEGFVQRPFLSSMTAPGLLGSTADRER